MTPLLAALAILAVAASAMAARVLYLAYDTAAEFYESVTRGCPPEMERTTDR